MSKYTKTIVAVVVAAAYAIGAAFSDGKVTNAEWIAIGTQVLAAAGVYYFPNRDSSGNNLSGNRVNGI